MPENILVVEYEPRYTDRVRQALAGQPFEASFARDGEEAIRALEANRPRLIVLSSVVPKISTPELIRAIRGRDTLAQTPILVTMSGYAGKSPRQDAIRMGASDILPKPYSETEFLGKIQQMLGVRESSGAKVWAPELDPDFTPGAVVPPGDQGQLTSNEIFGDLLDDHSAAPAGARKTMKPKDDLRRTQSLRPPSLKSQTAVRRKSFSHCHHRRFEATGRGNDRTTRGAATQMQFET